ncbi:MAG: VOC family protein [Bacillota bacterium]
MKLSIYLNFNGNSKEVIEFYKMVFDAAEPYVMLYGDMPGKENYPMSAETEKLVMHSSLYVGELGLMISDVTPDRSVTFGSNVTLTVDCDSVEEAKLRWERIKPGGNVQMELGETFFADCYGQLVDKFGIQWQILHERPN